MDITPEHHRLNLGCGFNKLEYYWNVDASVKCNPDQVVDLESVPWPWDDNYFEKITANHILEHLGQDPKLFAKIIQELYRVAKDKAELYIQIPHHRCDVYWDDFTHVRPLTEKTFRMFDQKVNFESVKRKLSDSVYGIQYDVDIEVNDVTYNIVEYWRNLQNEGMLGAKELNIKLNTMCNVAESANIYCTIHKPGRYADIIG